MPTDIFFSSLQTLHLISICLQFSLNISLSNYFYLFQFLEIEKSVIFFLLKHCLVSKIEHGSKETKPGIERFFSHCFSQAKY